MGTHVLLKVLVRPALVIHVVSIGLLASSLVVSPLLSLVVPLIVVLLLFIVVVLQCTVAAPERRRGSADERHGDSQSADDRRCGSHGGRLVDWKVSWLGVEAVTLVLCAQH